MSALDAAASCSACVGSFVASAHRVPPTIGTIAKGQRPEDGFEGAGCEDAACAEHANSSCEALVACFESVAVLVVIPKAVVKVDLARYLVLDQGAPVEGWCSSEERCTAIVLH